MGECECLSCLKWVDWLRVTNPLTSLVPVKNRGELRSI